MTENITIFIAEFLEKNGISINPTGRIVDGYAVDDIPKIDIIQGNTESQVVLQAEFASMSVVIDNELAENDPKLQNGLDEFLINYRETKTQVEQVLGLTNTIQ
jgi:hypothetical protein